MAAASLEEGEWCDREAQVDVGGKAAALPAGVDVPMRKSEEDQMIDEAEGVERVPDDRVADDDVLFASSGWRDGMYRYEARGGDRVDVIWS